MTKLKMMPLVAMISAGLVGCGGSSGGGGGGPVAPTYNWQFVQLYSADRSSIGSGCAIFDDLDNTEGKVIAAKVATDGFKVLFHNADGSIVAENTIENIPATGLVSIKSSLVPDGGYVSVEEIDGSISGGQDVFMFTVQKDFLKSLTLNIRQKQSSSNSCFRGEQYNLNVSDDAVVTVAQSSADTKYYQSSYIDGVTDGSVLSSNIPVKAPLTGFDKALMTAFDTLSNNQYTNLTYFSLIPSSSIYDVTNPPSPLPAASLNDVETTGVNLEISGITLDSSSAIKLGHAGDIYHWQPIYSGATKLSYTASNLLNASGWVADLKGVTDGGGWLFSGLSKFEGVDLTVDIPLVGDFSSTAIGTCSGQHCVNSAGFTGSDYTIQRTHVRSHTQNSSRLFYQTIFAKPSLSQVLMESTEEEIVPSNSDRVEVSVSNLDIQNADGVQYFLEKNVNIQNLVTVSVPNFTDVNGAVSLPSAIRVRYLKLMSEAFVTLENGVN
ncbi:TPA: flagellar sheath protein A [Vibrio vulnificus]|nr:flagellar sheath protein A [Vibrio vulnificus]